MNTRLFKIVFGLLIVGALPFFALAQALNVPVVTETVIVPFTNFEAVTTDQRYSGDVLLIVSGTGQASASDTTDAFFRFTGAQGVLLPEPVLANEFGLEIDGTLASELLEAIPDYAPDHVYVFPVSLGDTPRTIRFRIGDGGVTDNSGEFYVRVVPLS